MQAKQDAPRVKLESLEVGRFLAASVVMFSHLPWFAHAFATSSQKAVFGGWVPPGPFAVQYFFALSGFVMFTAHHQDFAKPKAPLRFWWRRACRIYPMYWLSLLAALLCLQTPPAAHMLAELVTLAPLHMVDVVSPAWSLHVEMAFYAIFGLCLLPWVGRPLLALWVVTVLALCWWPELQNWLHVPQLLQSHTALFIFGTNFTFFHVQFFSGLLAGWLYKTRPPGPRAAWALLMAGGGHPASLPARPALGELLFHARARPGPSLRLWRRHPGPGLAGTVGGIPAGRCGAAARDCLLPTIYSAQHLHGRVPRPGRPQARRRRIPCGPYLAIHHPVRRRAGNLRHQHRRRVSYRPPPAAPAPPPARLRPIRRVQRA
ncbi:peptidoglycan/LPS O-acetylase OafA/YrhL [Acidocella aromatica]|uniref:Peptidoglycan/LPS O-acetylase OafA/YrhL n=1 Tax=Acidocella aromatica TaxID=1303579 RepID=A0A840V8P3_9PROT|nr:peptidoglycan/LPS O-acetylase OafA/YrhL [Acidocella aromatica]